MPSWTTLAVALAVCASTWLLFVAGLVVAGRGSDARAVARLIPDCLVLLRRVMRDERTPRSSKVLLAFVVGYLLFPIDLVPDVIPVAGQLDDAILVALALRRILRNTRADLLGEHWPGPPESLALLRRLA